MSQNINNHNKNQTQYYKSADQPTIQTTDSPYVQRHVDNLLEFGKISKQDKILEVGAGVGRFSQLIHAKGFDITASDLSPELIAKLNRNTTNIESFVGDINNLPKQQNYKYDVLMGFFVLHHLSDLNESFASLAKGLKPGGQILFCEPNAWYFPFYLQILLTPRMKWSVDKGVRNMRQKIFNQALQSNGFENIEYQYYGVFPPGIYNTTWGSKVDHTLSRRILPSRSKAFLMVKANLK